MEPKGNILLFSEAEVAASGGLLPDFAMASEADPMREMVATILDSLRDEEVHTADADLSALYQRMYTLGVLDWQLAVLCGTAKDI